MASVIHPPALRLHLSSGAVEFLKWTALACMVVDHVHAVFYGRDLGLAATAVGRIAMPLFAIVVGYNMARPGADLLRMVRRLLLVGVIAMPAYAYLFAGGSLWPGNVLFTFAAAGLVLHLTRSGAGFLAFALLFASGLLVEYSWAGVLLVLGAYAFARYPSPATLAAGLLSLAALCIFNGNAWALLALPVIVLASHWAPSVPRSGRFFLWFYPAHIAVLAAFVVAFGGVG